MTLASNVSIVIDISTTNKQEQVYYDKTTWPLTLKTLQFTEINTIQLKLSSRFLVQ